LTLAMTTTATTAITSVVSDDGVTSSVDVAGRGGGVCGVVSVLADSTECRREKEQLEFPSLLGMQIQYCLR